MEEAVGVVKYISRCSLVLFAVIGVAFFNGAHAQSVVLQLGEVWKEWEDSNRGALCTKLDIPAFAKVTQTGWNGRLALKYNCTQGRVQFGPSILVCHDDGVWRAGHEPYTHAPACGFCDDNTKWKWNGAEQRCEVVVNNLVQTTWHEAESNCSSIGAELLTIPNKGVQQRLANLLKKARFEGHYLRLVNHTRQRKRFSDFWIGLRGMHNSDGILEFKWWPSGATATYENWDIGSQKVQSQNISGCVLVDENTKKWRLSACDRNYFPFICQKQPNIDCGPPPSISRGRFIVSKDLDTADYVCEDGFAFDRANATKATATCQQSGKHRGLWLDSIGFLAASLQCKAIFCKDPGHVGNAHRHGKNFTFGAKVHYRCHHGYETADKKSRIDLQCRADGTWSQVLHACKPLVCEDPGRGENAERVIDGNNFTFSSRVTYSCRYGFHVVGNGRRSIECLGDRTWSFPALKCEACTCNVNFTEKEICDWSSGRCLCSHDKNAAGEDCGQCKNGTFRAEPHSPCKKCYCVENNTQPDSNCNNATGQCSCKDGFVGKNCELRKRCHPPRAGLKSVRSGSDFTYGGTVTYHCHYGYQINNKTKKSIICRKDGTWSGEEANCTPVHCPDPGQGKNARRDGNSFTFSSRLTYSCQSGFKIVGGGRETIECLGNGNWSFPPLRCEQCACNANFTENKVCDWRSGRCLCHQDMYAYGEKCDECQPGSFRLEGKDGPCQWCHCHRGNVNHNEVCNNKTGQCPCRLGCLGKTCQFCDQKCEADTVTHPRGPFVFAATNVNEVVRIPCPNGPRCDRFPAPGTVTRRCVSDKNLRPKWETPAIEECGYKDTAAATLECNFPATVTAANVDKVADNLVNFTSSSKSMSGGAIKETANILSKMVTVKSPSPKIGHAVTGVISQVIGADINVSDGSSFSTTSNKLLGVAENYAASSPMGNDTERLFESENLAIKMVDSNSKSLHKLNLTAKSFSNEPPRAVARLPEGMPVSGDQRVQAVTFKKSSLFQEVNPNKTGIALSSNNTTIRRVNSIVFSVKIGETELSNLPEPVELDFRLTESVGNQTCVFWDFKANGGNGAWSSEGCRLKNRTKNKNGEITATCSCTHLTHFAVMMDLDPSSVISSSHETALSYITYIGCGLSLLGLFCTFILLALFRRLRQQRQMQIIGHMCVAWAAAIIMFISGIRATNSKSACTALAFLLHYFLLVVFCWTLMQAFYLYTVLVRVYTQTKSLVIKMAIFSWCVPMVIVFVTLGATEVSAYEPATTGKRICVLNLEHAKGAFIGAFLAPICLALLINSVFFVLVMRTIIKPRPGTKKRTLEDNKRDFKVAISLSVLLGFTWLFGLGIAGDAKLAFQYIFTILNAFLGFFIFFLHIGLRREVHEEVSSALSTRKTRRSIYSSTLSSGSSFRRPLTTSKTFQPPTANSQSCTEQGTPVGIPSTPVKPAGSNSPSEPSADSGTDSVRAESPPRNKSPLAESLKNDVVLDNTEENAEEIRRSIEGQSSDPDSEEKVKSSVRRPSNVDSGVMSSTSRDNEEESTDV